jgi:hypothetical protein
MDFSLEIRKRNRKGKGKGEEKPAQQQPGLPFFPLLPLGPALSPAAHSPLPFPSPRGPFSFLSPRSAQPPASWPELLALPFLLSLTRQPHWSGSSPSLRPSPVSSPPAARPSLAVALLCQTPGPSPLRCTQPEPHAGLDPRLDPSGSAPALGLGRAATIP